MAPSLRPCEHCGVPTVYRHVSRRCPGYAPLWAGDAEQKLFRNLELVDGALMVSLTAPGAAVLAWDVEHCRALGPHRCSGLLGCQVRADCAEEWNRCCRPLWRKLWDDVQHQIRREFGKVAPLCGYVWEMQTRGVWHLHLVLDTAAFGDRARSERAAELLKERAPRHAFGEQVHFDRSASEKGGRAAAAYLSSYLLGKKEGAGKRPLRETVQTLEAVRTIVYISPRLSKRSGITMTSLRHKRWLHHRIPSLAAWLRYVSIEVLYEAVREGLWEWRAYREHLLGLDPFRGLSPPAPAIAA